jgi:predicted phosphodiesterase
MRFDRLKEEITMRRLLATTVVIACIVSGPRCTGASQSVRPAQGGSTAGTTGTRTDPGGQLTLPNKKDSIKLLVIGDSGTGGGTQRTVATRIAAFHKLFPFTFAIMAGDNLYGSERDHDYERKFERPYKPLLDAGVKFYAALGNHDDPAQRNYKLFNMNGERFYSFKPEKLGGVRFFALDSNYMTPDQLKWLEKELAASGSDWKIPFFHHPLYSSGGRHGSDVVLREQLEPLFIKHGVQVVVTGHEHFYERTKPQNGIVYFITGNSAKLRKGDIERSALTAKGYDQGYTFTLFEIDGDNLHFQTISSTGSTVDSGVIQRKPAAASTKPPMKKDE